MLSLLYPGDRTSAQEGDEAVFLPNVAVAGSSFPARVDCFIGRSEAARRGEVRPNRQPAIPRQFQTEPRTVSEDLIWAQEVAMIRKLKSGEYRLYSRKVDPKTQKRRNLGTFKSREAAEKHEREVQYFKRH